MLNWKMQMFITQLITPVFVNFLALHATKHLKFKVQKFESHSVFRRIQVKFRVDSLMHETLAGKDMYRKLFSVIRMLLVLSHGQASVERGFSSNKETGEVNPFNASCSKSLLFEDFRSILV